jgi:hypothetical protein
MVRKCPPGVFCFENITLVIFAIIMIVVAIYAHSYFFGHGSHGSHGQHCNQYHGSHHGQHHGPLLIASADPLSNSLDFGIGGPSSNQDVLLNPYVPPLRDNSVGATRPIYDIRGGVETIHYGGMDTYGGGGGGGGGGVRVNVPTRSVDTTYRQVGILTRSGGARSGSVPSSTESQETILPLIGRPLFTNRDKWQFYTLSDKNNAIKLPITVNGKSGTNEYGCNNVGTGDMVYVEGYNDAFRVSVYDSASLRYLPF